MTNEYLLDKEKFRSFILGHVYQDELLAHDNEQRKVIDRTLSAVFEVVCNKYCKFKSQYDNKDCIYTFFQIGEESDFQPATAPHCPGIAEIRKVLNDT